MKLSLIYIGLALLIVSCDFDGVKTTDNNDTEVDTSNTVLDLVIENGIDSAESEQPFALLKDTILGEPNLMVYNGEGGLRVEWTVKNENDPIKLNDVVLVNYTARVAAGEIFDSNAEMNAPAPLKTNIGMMVEGWEKGLLEMNIGDVGRIMIPNALAYGEDGYSTIVPPGADIIVEIEIIKRITPIVLDEGVKVYTWSQNPNANTPNKDDLITFDYFAYTKGSKAGLYDNSFKDSQPFSFRFENDNVIDGLHQGMKVIRSGENAFIEIPAKLAYGSKGLVDLVQKNTDIVYDVRILSID
ncbi:MAG: FKBP-type peptidyl-prolyl cis-trans isomerase [Crocinitomix sp.]|jgi:FKBP-type peptidyl-prolyl cis-trans isomerase